eukprot:gene5224-5286_t
MQFSGCSCLRQHLVLSILSGKQVTISDIRVGGLQPGLTAYEANLLKLVERVTNGTSITINKTGTSLTFAPGLMLGGSYSHACNPGRAVTYYLEAIACLAPFGHREIAITLTGVTNCNMDVGVDLF